MYNEPELPYYATSVTLTEYWDIDYGAVTWSFGGAPSGTLNLGSGRVAWSRTVSNTYRIDHGWNEIRFSVGGGIINRVKYDITGDFQFGSNFFQTVTAFSSRNITTIGGIPDVWINC